MKNSEHSQSLSVGDFFAKFGEMLCLEQICGEGGFERHIISPTAKKPGLRMIEKKIELERGNIQVLGRTEISYIKRFAARTQKKIISNLISNDIPCFILSKETRPGKSFRAHFEKKQMPLFTTVLSTGKFITILNELLAEEFATRITVHGVLLDVHRRGVLILGKSGIGKSECAIDLIIQGSKLIADDVVEIRKIGSHTLVGVGPENIKYLLEVRGIGIVNIKDLFGTTCVMEKREIDMVVELDRWDSETEYDRLGIDTRTHSILDVELPYIILPVSPGRNIASVIDVAVRNQILKETGKKINLSSAIRE
ncbi:MAG: HPr(Ser) kinase/phosphatase [Candidatus Dadabacteria bacterium]|nr:HPr(Ser) kinase/phosphatase [Candidatus Dadabacteria bacterium]MCY4262852.1 HPr(Ser) kinase/phosphatase [Candidatus Dadabacteria bacterium]